jgi:hypothetical protein
MKKIVIVGHPQSGYQDVESLLNACGMTAARPSRREGFSPVEIGCILNKAHAIQSMDQTGEGQSIEQIMPNPVWHGMALDLMLGNLEQDVWGWADPQAIYLLNYWRDLDPQITFMLVYDKPHSVLTRLGANEAASLSADVLRERIGNWVAYNAALLHFFHRNQQRCLLVNSEQVCESVGSYLQQVRARIDAPWSERMEQLLALDSADAASPGDGTMDIACAADSINGARLNRLETFAVTEKEPKRMPPENALVLFLADALIQQNPAGLQMYEELQAVANLPLVSDLPATHDAGQAWLAMAEQDQRLNQAETLLSEKERLVERLAQSQAAAEQLARAREREIGQQTRAHKALQKAQQASLQESDLLLAQLHQVQEELERQHLSSRQQEQKLQALMQGEKLSTQKNKELGEAQVCAARQASELGEQLDVVRKQFATKNEQAGKEAALLKAKLQAAEAKLQVVEAKATDAAPVIANNNPALEQENEQLLIQLHQVQEELERFYLENQKLKVELVKMPKHEPMRYGAANFIKQQLPYRLGATLVKRSRSLTGWLGMPAALARETRQFKNENTQGNNGVSLPIESYADAHEAIKVRQHLSYRLGTALVANANSPVGWVKLPWALLHETRQYWAQRKTLAVAYNGTSQNRTAAATR